MISRFDLQDRAREWGLREEVVEKDYVLGWVLWGIGADPDLGFTWAFKGGTCLKKCFLETFRFSEDLDFSVLPDGPVRQAAVEPLIARILARVTEASGVQFAIRPPVFREKKDGGFLEARIYYQGPRGAPQPARIKLDVSALEFIARPTVLREIQHPFPDRLPEPGQVRCYAFEEVFAEKLRAMAQRGRPRDLYDIVHLFRRPDFRRHPEVVYEVLGEKCAAKSIAIPTLESITASSARAELAAEWENMLAHQLPALPPLESFWDELPGMFLWLEGAGDSAELAPVASGKNEDMNWRPPPTAWHWGQAAPIETIRFAGANQLLVELDYQGSTRVVEPYSLRKTTAGRLLLHAVRSDNRQPRSYRIDRIEGVRVLTRPFTPVYQIEFAAMGAVPVAPTRRRPQGGLRDLRREPAFRVRCPVCLREFRRKRRSSKLKSHKDEVGLPCSGRRGIDLGKE